MNVSIRASSVLTFFLIAATVGSTAQRDSWSYYRDPQLLVSNCAGMAVIGFMVQKPEDGPIDLTDDAVQNALEARIRSAGIYQTVEDGAEQFILARIMVTGQAFSVELELNRFVANAGYGHGGIVRVWDDMTLGTHGYDAPYVLGHLSRMVDRFVVEYLRANEPACAKDEPPPKSN